MPLPPQGGGFQSQRGLMHFIVIITAICSLPCHQPNLPKQENPLNFMVVLGGCWESLGKWQPFYEAGR